MKFHQSCHSRSSKGGCASGAEDGNPLPRNIRKWIFTFWIPPNAFGGMTRGRMTMKGFTLVELLISISILALVSTIAVLGLRSTRSNEELQTAARLLAGDIRAIQTRAQAGANVKACDVAAGTRRACEAESPSVEPCVSDCSPTPPSAFGITLSNAMSRYDLFADIEQDDWRETSLREAVAVRTLGALGSNKMVIDTIQTELGPVDTVHIASERQSGRVRINACGEAGLPDCAPGEPQTVSIILRHAATNATASVKVNSVSGRIIIE